MTAQGRIYMLLSFHPPSSQSPGVIGLSLAQYASQVLGIELVEQAVEDARWTAAFNGTLLTFWRQNEELNFLCCVKDCVGKGITNCEFHTG